MKSPFLFYALCLAASVTPLLQPPKPPAASVAVAWPQSYAGLPLRAVPLSPQEQQFYRGFPGAAARLTDGQRDLIFRHLTAPTRKLHSSADCFRALGYTVSESVPEVHAQGAHWQAFTAQRGLEQLRIRERITSSYGTSAWTDVSAWYWHALFHPQDGPWLSTLLVEQE